MDLQRVTRPSWGAVLMLGLATMATAEPKNVGFDLDRLPKGKNVTIPIPATTYVPLTSSVVLTATDLPQRLSFRPVNLRSGQMAPLRLSIYDQNSERVQYFDLSPGTPILYEFKALGPITVVTVAKSAAPSGLTLQVESDKPLEIAH